MKKVFGQFFGSLANVRAIVQIVQIVQKKNDRTFIGKANIFESCATLRPARLELGQLSGRSGSANSTMFGEG